MTRILRTAALIGAGSYVVHQLRFAFAPGQARAIHGHGYLAPLGAVLVGVLLLALATALARIAGGSVDRKPRLARLWPGATASLVAVYCVQESLEAILTHDHAHGIFTHGGWLALPLALAVGLAIALVTRGAATASEVAAAARRAPAIALVDSSLDTLLTARSPRPPRPIHRHQAARGPPLASV